MSIDQNQEERKTPDELPMEEEFDIVSSGSKPNTASPYRKHGFTVAILGLISLASFGIGKVFTGEESKTPIQIVSGTEASVSRSFAATSSENEAVKLESFRALPGQQKSSTKTSGPKLQSIKKSALKASKPTLVGTVLDGPIVASKNGTKYYLVTCPGASRISTANKIFFATSSEAQKVGLSPASACRGLK